MILYRYIYKEVIAVTLGITTVLLLALLSNQLIRYLAAAANGKLATVAVLQLVVYYLPYLFGLLLPLALYLGVLWAFGRFAQDGELNVIKACGFGPKRLYVCVLHLACCVMVVVAVLIFWLRPITYSARAALYANATQGSVLQILLPGRFQSSHGDQRVFYVESMSHDHKRVKNVFMAERQQGKEGQEYGAWVIQSAHKGMQFTDPKTDENYLVTTQGYRYEGKPGTPHFRVIKYASNGVLIPKDRHVPIRKVESWTLHELWHARHQNTKAMAELQWRISMPIAVMLLVFCAIGLVQNTSGKNRYAHLIPALLIYIFYMNMLIVGRNWIASDYHAIHSLWWVHLMVLGIAGFCIYQPRVKRL